MLIFAVNNIELNFSLALEKEGKTFLQTKQDFLKVLEDRTIKTLLQYCKDTYEIELKITGQLPKDSYSMKSVELMRQDQTFYEIDKLRDKIK